ncbi:hypothetical protein B0H13DRAFT_1568977, partial [Mycena leptocephala]
GACGDTYNDSSMTAAVSYIMYDNWPGYVKGNPNTNPICGRIISGHDFFTHDGISIQVEIVDRCTGCKVNDIDLTP